MSDYASGLPIRTEADGADERLHAKIVDGTTPSQRATVDVDGNVHIEVHGNNPGGSDEVLLLSELGAVVPDGVYHATNNSNPGNVGVVVHTRGATPADADQIIRATGISTSTVHAMDIALHDEDGVPFSEANPLPVYQSPSPGDPIHNYDTSSAIAANASDNHDYIVSASRTLYLTEIWAAASGKLKIELREETSAGSGVFNSIAVGFNSTSNPNISLRFAVPLEVETGKILRIVRTNLDNQAQDVYSTIVGSERA